MPEEIDCDQLQKLEEFAMLQGAVGYCLHLIEELHKGKLKTIVDVTNKLTSDGDKIGGALSHHYRDRLKNAGFAVGLFDEKTEKKQEK